MYLSWAINRLCYKLSGVIVMLAVNWLFVLRIYPLKQILVDHYAMVETVYWQLGISKTWNGKEQNGMNEMNGMNKMKGMPGNLSCDCYCLCCNCVYHSYCALQVTKSLLGSQKSCL